MQTQDGRQRTNLFIRNCSTEIVVRVRGTQKLSTLCLNFSAA